MIPGTIITLGGKKYLLPPMNVEAMESEEEFLTEAMGGSPNPASGVRYMRAVSNLVHITLRRNYPDLTVEEVKKHVDFSNMHDLLANLFKTSGFQDKVEGE